MTTYLTQSEFASYLSQAKPGDIIYTTYKDVAQLRIVTAATPRRVDFRNLLRPVTGSFDLYKGAWDSENLLRLDFLGDDLDVVTQDYPELFL